MRARAGPRAARHAAARAGRAADGCGRPPARAPRRVERRARHLLPRSCARRAAAACAAGGLPDDARGCGGISPLSVHGNGPPPACWPPRRMPSLVALPMTCACVGLIHLCLLMSPGQSRTPTVPVLPTTAMPTLAIVASLQLSLLRSPSCPAQASMPADSWLAA